MTDFNQLANGLVLGNTQSVHCEQLEALQRICFPTLDDNERFKAEHYRRHIEIFPEGQFVVLDHDTVIGSTTTLRLDFDFDHIDHTFNDIVAGGWLTAHTASGHWLYGADIGTHPRYRGRGVARALYAARQELVRRSSLEGQVTAGMMPGYASHREQLSIHQYYECVLRGKLFDPTISLQMKIGFETRGLLEHYLHDPVCEDACVLLVLPAEKDVRVRKE